MSSSDLRAEGEADFACGFMPQKAKCVVPFTASRARQSRLPLIKNRWTFVQRFFIAETYAYHYLLTGLLFSGHLIGNVSCLCEPVKAKQSSFCQFIKGGNCMIKKVRYVRFGNKNVLEFALFVQIFTLKSRVDFSQPISCLW